MPDGVNTRLRQSVRWSLVVGLLASFVQFRELRPSFAQPLPISADASAIMATPMPTLPSPAATLSNIPQSANLASISHAPPPTMLQILTSARRGFCARVRVSPIGQMAANMRKPLSTVTGGLVAAEKVPHADEQAQPGPEGTAAQLKAVNLQAPKRRAAVRELRAVDVRYHPEAEGILVAALRADPSECVRYEAALTIETLPACTEKIAKALRTCIDSSSADGNPAELSLRVRNQAAIALAKCECCLPQSNVTPQLRPEYPMTQIPIDNDSKSNTLPPLKNPAISQVSSQGSAGSTVQTAGWWRPVEGKAIESDRSGMVTESIPDQSNRPKNLLEVFKSARSNPKP